MNIMGDLDIFGHGVIWSLCALNFMMLTRTMTDPYIIDFFLYFQRYLIALCLVFAIVYVNATPEPVAEAEAEADADADAYYG